jgi:hypothetical protein
VYWHLTVPDGTAGSACPACRLVFLIRPSLLEVVQAVSPGQPDLPDWVYRGAIIGVQEGWPPKYQIRILQMKSKTFVKCCAIL